ncbi:MAG: type II secretion system major pseudopilin GspG [Gammaproteobacteria bacterium]
MLPSTSKLTHRPPARAFSGRVRARTAGLALFEVVMLVAILGITGAVIVTSLLGRPDPAHIAAARQEIHTLATALQSYGRDNHRYPSDAQGLEALVAKPTLDPLPANWRPYLDVLPLDPWGHAYQYQYPGAHGTFDVWSYGPGGPSASGSDVGIIGNWNLDVAAPAAAYR